MGPLSNSRIAGNLYKNRRFSEVTLISTLPINLSRLEAIHRRGLLHSVRCIKHRDRESLGDSNCRELAICYGFLKNYQRRAESFVPRPAALERHLRLVDNYIMRKTASLIVYAS